MGKTADVGTVIKFKRANIDVTGTIVLMRENSAIVNVGETFRRLLDLPNEMTVVNHKKYTIIK